MAALRIASAGASALRCSTKAQPLRRMHHHCSPARRPHIACAATTSRLLQQQQQRPQPVLSTPPTINSSFSTSSRLQALSSPLNVPKWLTENSHLLQPPVNNYCVYDKDVTVMIVGGPNARTDYHINETPEWFYQYKGAMLLKTVDDGEFKDVVIREGDMFLLPPNVPHNPVRFKGTVGIVIEQKRPPDSIDRLRWYCQSCGEQVHESSFHCTNLGTQIKDAVNAFKSDPEARECRNCGEVCDTAPKSPIQPQT